MIDTPQTRLERKMRLGGSSVLRHIGQTPRGIISAGSKRQTMSILGATGFDAHVSLSSPLAIGERVTLMMGCGSDGSEIGSPGIVHWVNTAQDSYELGIVLQERLPEEFTVKPPGCERSSVRYACRVDGQLSWTIENTVSVKAIATNYARDGVCFKAALAPEVDVPIVFQWNTTNQDSQVAGVVRWVIGQNHSFLVGCELSDHLGYELSGIRI